MLALRNVQDGQQVLLDLRPKHLRVEPAGEPGIAFEVKVVEFSGADTLLACEARASR